METIPILEKTPQTHYLTFDPNKVFPPVTTGSRYNSPQKKVVFFRVGVVRPTIISQLKGFCDVDGELLFVVGLELSDNKLHMWDKNGISTLSTEPNRLYIEETIAETRIPFDLELARSGKYEILCKDYNNYKLTEWVFMETLSQNNNRYPIIAVINGFKYQFDRNGYFLEGGGSDPRQLMLRLKK